MISTPVKHCACPFAKINATIRCPIIFDCCVTLFFWVGLRRLPWGPNTLSVDMPRPTHFHVDRGGHWIQLTPHPCNNRTHSFLYYPSSNSDGVVDCCVVDLLFIPISTPPAGHFFTSKSYQLGLIGSIKWSLPVIHQQQSLYTTDWLLC